METKTPEVTSGSEATPHPVGPSPGCVLMAIPDIDIRRAVATPQAQNKVHFESMGGALGGAGGAPTAEDSEPRSCHSHWPPPSLPGAQPAPRWPPAPAAAFACPCGPRGVHQAQSALSVCTFTPQNRELGDGRRDFSGWEDGVGP